LPSMRMESITKTGKAGEYEAAVEGLGS
jgi:hypothetical protein